MATSAHNVQKYLERETDSIVAGFSGSNHLSPKALSFFLFSVYRARLFLLSLPAAAADAIYI